MYEIILSPQALADGLPPANIVELQQPYVTYVLWYPQRTMMISLIYVSSAVHLLSTDELNEILEVSQRNNETGPVTGLLLYKDGNFMQLLDGPEEAVMNIFGKIQKDTRHKNIILLTTTPISEREFADWRMAFLNLDDKTIQHKSAYSEFLSIDFTDHKYRKTPSLAYKMLLSFKKNML